MMQPTNFGDPTPVTYFIQAVDGGHIKIGRSTVGLMNLRLTALQTGNPQELRITSYLKGDREFELHDLFSDLRVRGEWFRPDPSLAGLARAVPGMGTKPDFQAGYAEGYAAALAELKRCPNCRSADAFRWLDDENYRTRRGVIEMRCRGCSTDFQMQDPAPLIGS